MRVVFYKLPSEAGENVLVTESYTYVESEIAILLDDADLDLPCFDLISTEDGDSVTPVEESDPDIYMFIDTDLNVDATLPFKTQEHAEAFLSHLTKWQEYINKGHDEQ